MFRKVQGCIATEVLSLVSELLPNKDRAQLRRKKSDSSPDVSYLIYLGRLNLALATTKDAVSTMGRDLHLKRVESERALVDQLSLRQPGESQS